MTVHATRPSPLLSAFAAFSTAARAVGLALSSTAEAIRAGREAERLFSRSDAELAQMGLTRDAIVQHAFRDYLAR